ncbi:MAG: TadE/TadG family type IV pilus assembly protein [Candidatus Dormibacteraceae bacterium]
MMARAPRSTLPARGSSATGFRRRRDGRQGQALVEFAISSIFLLLLLMGVIDFGFLYTDRLAIANAARGGARWASKHPTNWSNASTPDSDTIEGQIQAAGGVTEIPNDDSHITINYYDISSGTSVLCGNWSAATNAFVPASTYTETSCVAPGTMVEVKVTYTYPLLTPMMAGLFGSGVPVSAAAAFIEER